VTRPRAADDFPAIRPRMEELRAGARRCATRGRRPTGGWVVYQHQQNGTGRPARRADTCDAPSALADKARIKPEPTMAPFSQ
jgi:hypothetical protein